MKEPLYTTDRGAAYLGDSLEILANLPDNSVDLVFTSPPYALHFKKEYGNVSKDDYVGWFLPFARIVLLLVMRTRKVADAMDDAVPKSPCRREQKRSPSPADIVIQPREMRDKRPVQ